MHLLIGALSVLIATVGVRAYPYYVSVLTENIAVARSLRTSDGLEPFSSVIQPERTLHAADKFSFVQVTTSSLTYGLSEPVVVTIVNGLSVPIHALTGQTYCTIVTVQRNVNGEWNPEGRCLAAGPPGWVSIAAGDRTVVDVRPRLPSDRPLAPNRHRIMFTFRQNSTENLSRTVFSAEFRIAGAGSVPSRRTLQHSHVPLFK